MNQEHQTTEKLLSQFRSVLFERVQIEDIEIELEPNLSDGQRGDLRLGITVDGERSNILVEVKRHAYPRDIERVRTQAAKQAGVDQVMVWAETLSEGARRLLEASGIGYFDASGSLSIRLGMRQVLIDRPPLKPNWRDVGSLFTPEREKVLHALLLHWDTWRTGTDLADASGASPNTVSVLMRELEKRGMVQSEGNGRSVRRRLLDPGELLDTWANDWESRKVSKLRWFAFTQNPASLGEMLARRMGEGQPHDWAFTGQYAANSFTRLLTAVSGYDLIVRVGATASVAEHLGLKRADKGFNVTLHECDEFALQHRLELADRPGSFASPVVQYLELANAGGRSRELANALKGQLLVKGAPNV